MVLSHVWYSAMYGTQLCMVLSHVWHSVACPPVCLCLSLLSAQLEHTLSLGSSLGIPTLTEEAMGGRWGDLGSGGV